MSEVLEKSGDDTSHQDLAKVALETLRQKHREQKNFHREQQREFFVKKVRFLQDDPKFENLVEGNITELAKTLKCKGKVSCELLITIMNVLLESKENITAFLKVDGALQALLRLLSGQNEKFQLLAAQCICNLALGNEKQNLQILKASESYLMIHLSGRNQYVIEVCAIALGNLSRQGRTNVELLMNQGFLPKILSLFDKENPTLEAAAVYALTQLIYYGIDILRLEDLEKCLLTILPVFKQKSFLVAFLMSVLSSCKDIHCHFISNAIHFEALKYLLISLKEKEKEAVYFLRIVSNLITEETGKVATDLIEKESYVIRECVVSLMQSEKQYLKKECLNCLGNFLNHPVQVVQLFGVEVVKENFESIKCYKKSYNDSATEAMVA